MAEPANGVATASEITTIILTLLSALGALASALAAWRAASATRRSADATQKAAEATQRAAEATRIASEAQLVERFISEYFDPGMAEALRVLRRWKSVYGEEFEFKWRQLLDQSETSAQEADRARRYVKGYFLKADRLRDSGLIGDVALVNVASVDGINILFDVVEPMEFALNQSYDRAAFDRLRQKVGRYGSGQLLPAIP